MGNEGAGASRGGGTGFHNEDAFLVREGLGLYVVCDGASDRAGGEIAARVAADALEEAVRKTGSEVDVRHARVARFVVEKAMRRALAAVRDAGASDPELRGLSTTITMLLAQRDRGVIGHCGDSRAYLIRSERCHQLTVDHESTQLLEGDGPPVGYDVFGLELRPRDTIVLCTDGAEAVVEDPAIVRVAGDLSPRLLASRIVSAAHRQDTESDASAVVVRIQGERDPGWLQLSEAPRGTAFGHTLELDRSQEPR